MQSSNDSALQRKVVEPINYVEALLEESAHTYEKLSAAEQKIAKLQGQYILSNQRLAVAEDKIETLHEQCIYSNQRLAVAEDKIETLHGQGIHCQERVFLLEHRLQLTRHALSGLVNEGGVPIETLIQPIALDDLLRPAHMKSHNNPADPNPVSTDQLVQSQMAEIAHYIRILVKDSASTQDRLTLAEQNVDTLKEHLIYANHRQAVGESNIEIIHQEYEQTQERLMQVELR